MTDINYNAIINYINSSLMEGYKETPKSFGFQGRNLNYSSNVVLWQQVILNSLLGAKNEIDNGDEEDAVERANNYIIGRTFFINNSGEDVVIKLAGRLFNIQDGYAYACHPTEWLLINEKYGFERCDALTWVNNLDENVIVFNT